MAAKTILAKRSQAARSRQLRNRAVCVACTFGVLSVLLMLYRSRRMAPTIAEVVSRTLSLDSSTAAPASSAASTLLTNTVHEPSTFLRPSDLDTCVHFLLQFVGAERFAEAHTFIYAQSKREDIPWARWKKTADVASLECRVLFEVGKLKESKAACIISMTSAFKTKIDRKYARGLVSHVYGKVLTELTKIGRLLPKSEEKLQQQEALKVRSEQSIASITVDHFLLDSAVNADSPSQEYESGTEDTSACHTGGAACENSSQNSDPSVWSEIDQVSYSALAHSSSTISAY